MLYVQYFIGEAGIPLGPLGIFLALLVCLWYFLFGVMYLCILCVSICFRPMLAVG